MCFLLALLIFEYVFQAYRTIQLFYIVLKQAFLSLREEFGFLLASVIIFNEGVLQNGQVAQVRLYVVVLLAMKVVNEIDSRLIRSKLQHYDIRVLIWTF